MMDADDRLGYYSLVSAVHNVQEVKFPSLMIVCIFFLPKCKLASYRQKLGYRAEMMWYWST